MAAPASRPPRSLAERVALALLGAIATATDPGELRELAAEAETRVRGDLERVSDRAEAGLAGAFRELGLVTRDELEALELRLAQLEHRLRLLERAPAE